MNRFVVRRLLQAIPTLLGITILAFALTRLAPGDPIQQFTIVQQDMRPEQIEELRRQFGLDRPVPIQYLDWLSKVVRLDFGRSMVTRDSVIAMIWARVPNTLQLTVTAMLVGLVVGIPVGVYAALYCRSWLDSGTRVFAVLGNAIPQFWLGLVLILFFGVQLGWLPTGGMYDVQRGPNNLGDRLVHLLLPALVLATGWIAVVSRYVRTQLLEVIRQDYIRTARAKALTENAVLYRHALRNALIPVITVVGGSVANLVSGAAVIENVFSWPGMGRMAIEAVYSRDYPVIMGVVLVASVLVILGNLLADVAYGWADPRIQQQ